MKPLDPFGIPLHGAHLIEANAGTGKTYAITTLYVRLLLERRLTVGQILAVTYTNAATAELRRKVRDRIASTLAALRGMPPADDTIRELVDRRHAAGMIGADCAHLTAALYGFDDAAICTIHGFCQRVLQEHAFESGVAFDLELIGDDRLLIDELARDFWTRELYEAPPELVRALGSKITPRALALLARKAAAIPDLRVLPTSPGAAAGTESTAMWRERSLQLQIDLVAHTRTELRRRKAAAHTQSFDDLLQQLDEALQGDGAEALADKIRQRFAAALIDEFQDTDLVQYRIFERIYRHPNAALFLIGDPKQAIYAFRGADVFAYMRAKRALGSDPRTLAVNWRSSPSLVRGLNTLFGAAREQFIFPDIPFSASEPSPIARDELRGAACGRAPLRVLFVPRANHPLTGRAQMKKGRDAITWFNAAIAGEITRLLNSETYIRDERLVPGDVAVLCGTNNQSADLQAQLFALGVPTVMYGDTSVFDTAEAEAVGRVLRAMADPADAAAVAGALLTPLLGLTGEALAAARGDDREWDGWIERFQAWNECWTASGFTVAFRRLLDEREVPGRILSRPGGERCLTNVLHLAELLHAAAVEGRRGPRALVEWLQRMRADAAARTTVAAESAQIRLESDTRALKLITIHKSKGLQFPVVVCPFLWDGMLLHPSEQAAPFHDPADGDRLTIDLGSAHIDQHRALAKREALAEKLRLLYVALSRAEQLCIVAWGAFATCETSALGYLLHQPGPSTGGDLMAETSRRICELADPEMRADVERVAERSEGAIEVVDLTADPAPHFQLAADGGPALRLRRMSREVHQLWRMASFSALASADQPLPEPAEEGVDQDELADGVALEEADAAPTLRGFPRGRRLGNLVHKLFETTDFSMRDAAAMQANTLRWMPLYGIEARWADTLCAAVSDVLDTPLTADRPPLTLRQIPRNRRLDELEFVFPVALQADETPRGAVSASRLAAAFATHGAPWVAEYADRLRRLPFTALAGYMKGFIDLVFAAGERWYLVDYKTNDLGGRCEDYRHPQLLAEMYRHHYVLQYHLYTVALHRYLAQRLPGYDYARHFGGVFYLFVRGMAPTHETGCGIFSDHPPQALIEALSDLLAQPSDMREQRQ